MKADAGVQKPIVSIVLAWHIYFGMLLRGCVHQTSAQQSSHVNRNHLKAGTQATKELRLCCSSSSVVCTSASVFILLISWTRARLYTFN